jgi:hypothetical protein
MSNDMDTLLSRCGRVPVLCVGVAPHSPWNYGIRSASLSAGGSPAVTADIFCQGKDLAATAVSVFSGGMRIGSATVNGSAGRRTSVWAALPSDMQNPLGTVTLDCSDPFPADNTYYFVRDRHNAMRVLIIGEPDECFPLAAAFGATQTSQWLPMVRQCHTVTYDDIDSSALVVLNGLHQVPQPLLVLLRGTSFGPKAILFSPSPDSEYLGLSSGILPGRRPATLAMVSDKKPHAIVLPDTVSLLFGGFKKLKDPDATVTRYCTGLPGDVLLRLDNGRPFATMAIDTMGNSWVMTAVPIGRTGDGTPGMGALFASGLYVPLIDRFSRYALSAVHNDRSTWVAGTPARNPFFGAKRGALVFDAGGTAVAQWSGQPLVAFDTPGQYRIQPDGEPSQWVTALLDTSETDFSYRPLHAPEGRGASVKFLGAGEVATFVKTIRTGALSRWLWAVFALLLCAEPLLWERKTAPRNPS